MGNKVTWKDEAASPDGFAAFGLGAAGRRFEDPRFAAGLATASPCLFPLGVTAKHVRTEDAAGRRFEDPRFAAGLATASPCLFPLGVTA